MKKRLIVPVLFLLLLTACQTVSNSEAESAGSTPSSSHITPPPSSSVAPPTSVPATTPPAVNAGVAFIYQSSAYTILPPNWSLSDGLKEHLYWVEKSTKRVTLICEDPVAAYVTTDTHVYFVKKAEPTSVYVTPIGDFTNHQLLPNTPLPVIKEGLAFVYHGPNYIVLSPDWAYSEGVIDHLYWVVKATKECILVCEEPVIAYTTTSTHICFVKESEPTKIYQAPIGDFTNHQLLYESPYGTVNSMTNLHNYNTGIENYLQFVADNKKFVLLDMTTGESTVFMEQYYIGHAYISPGEDGSLFANWIWFEGKHKETDSPYAQFFYNRETGETTPDTSL